MRKLLASIQKEYRILIRDIGGLSLMFIMPLVLVFIITILQERTYQTIGETRVPVILIDNDLDSVGAAFSQGVKDNRFFEVTLICGADSVQMVETRDDVATGKYQMGIIIPEGTTGSIRNRVVALVQQQVPAMMNVDTANLKQSVQVDLFFDPITKESFRNIIKSNLREFSSKIETRIVFITYSRIIDAMIQQTTNIEYPEAPVIEFDESYVCEFGQKDMPSSVQHNVPAWTLFAMFFICIPLSSNIIKERYDGCLDRLKTMPVSYITVMLGKLLMFLAVTMMQAAVIVMVGIWIIPLAGLPQLQLGSNFAGFIIITISAGLAATGFGIMIGSIGKTYMQASTFGAVSTVILAALGGVWIPLYVMSPAMRQISQLSPMNWGIQGYYEYFLRDAAFTNMLPYAFKLIAFFIGCILIVYFYKKYIRQ